MSYLYLTEPQMKVSKDAGKYVISREGERILEIPQETLEGITLIDGVEITADAMIDFLRRRLPLAWISSRGRFYGRLVSMQEANVKAHILQVQGQGGELFLQIARVAIAAKLHNQVAILRRLHRQSPDDAFPAAMDSLQALENKIPIAKNAAQVMGYEGLAARHYFDALSHALPEGFSFEKRTRRPPRDAFNSLLSFGYTLLLNEFYAAILHEGLHPYLGFLHEANGQGPALASDLMEAWRPYIADTLALTATRKHILHPEDFVQEGAGVYLTPEGRKKYLRLYEKKMIAVKEGKQSRHRIWNDVQSFLSALLTGKAEKYQPPMLR